ncbi:MAG: hypothetical protein ABRQ39_32750 [Candidatus Eremiobacterota bacterium]
MREEDRERGRMQKPKFHREKKKERGRKMVGSEIYIPDYKEEENPEEEYKNWLESQGKKEKIQENFETEKF